MFIIMAQVAGKRMKMREIHVIHNYWMNKNAFQWDAYLRCVPTAAVAVTRCQYQGGLPPGRGTLTPLPHPHPHPREQSETSENITFLCDR